MSMSRSDSGSYPWRYGVDQKKGRLEERWARRWAVQSGAMCYYRGGHRGNDLIVQTQLVLAL